jgi:hypothetical protein
LLRLGISIMAHPFLRGAPFCRSALARSVLFGARAPRTSLRRNPHAKASNGFYQEGQTQSYRMVTENLFRKSPVLELTILKQLPTHA